MSLDVGPCIRVYWELLGSVLSPFIDNLPLHDSTRKNGSINRLVALIRGVLELIGANLEPQLYLPHLPEISQEKESEIHEVFCGALEKLESSVSEDILNLDNELQVDQKKTIFPRLSILQVLVHQPSGRPLRTRDYVYPSLNEEALSVLYTRLEALNKTVSAAFPAILHESHPTPLEESITVARHAQDFAKVAETLFTSVVRQMDEHCKRRRDGFIRVAVTGKSQVDMFLPVCRKKDELHPISCFLSAPSEPDKSLQLDSSQGGNKIICESIWRSNKRRQKLVIHFKDECLWERDSDFKRCAQFKKGSLSSFIWGHNEHGEGANSVTSTKQSRAEIPVLLAHSMLCLHKTRWFQHLWDMDRLILWTGPQKAPQDQHPYLASALSMDESTCAAAECIFMTEEEDCDPLYRHTLVLGFGLRLLEIESGRRFPPTDEDLDPEDDEKGTLPFLTLQRALDDLDGTGEVEDDYYNIAKACLEFHNNLKQKRFRDIETSIRELVAIHNLIFSPLLQLLAKKFKGAAADLLEWEYEARKAKPKDEDLKNSKGRCFPQTNSPPVVTVTTPETTHISLHAEVPRASKGGLCGRPDILQTVEYRSNNQLFQERFCPPPEQQVGIQKIQNSVHSLLRLDTNTVRVDAEIQTRSDSRVDGSTMLYEPSERSSEGWFEKVDQLSGLLRARRTERDIYYDKKKVKIAVIDTGISPQDPYAKDMGMGMYKDFVDDEDLEKRDTDGHGTDTVNLIFRVFDAPDVYVARVFKTKRAEDNTPKLVAKSINWALENGVDIIVMALGFSQWHGPIRDAVDTATANQILIFAAAGNWGGQESVAFPARLENVMCMFSTTPGNKNSSHINPPPDRQKTHNFAILGAEVKMPAPSGHPQRTIEGTSISCAIAAGLAGSLLDFSRQPICRDHIHDLKRKREMSAIFEDLSKAFKDGEYYCIAPWSLLKCTWDIRDRESQRIEIRDHLSRVLKNCR
ncbi:hypothetical protein TWF730_000811 [Orbilia blumenaviensis]|uniref:Peptidase S8/S53 domain-containing protein n=1 Tax=Orbilia blumenaviensis TaxID=1796055 RepID=A0AAV9VMS6_9PEZI